MSDTRPTLDESEQKAKAWWDSWPAHFQKEYGEEQIQVGVSVGPGAPMGDDLGLLRDLTGKNAVERGYGGGQFRIDVSKRGADVTGIDLSAAELTYLVTRR